MLMTILTYLEQKYFWKHHHQVFFITTETVVSDGFIFAFKNNLQAECYRSDWESKWNIAHWRMPHHANSWFYLNKRPGQTELSNAFLLNNSIKEGLQPYLGKNSTLALQVPSSPLVEPQTSPSAINLNQFQKGHSPLFPKTLSLKLNIFATSRTSP